MIKDAQSFRPPHLDYADYVGPVIVKPSPEEGEGLFTTKFIKAGDLIICEKAFSHVYNEKPDVGPNYCQVTNIPRNRPPCACISKNSISSIAHKLWRNPSLVADFNELHRRGYQGLDVKEIDGRPVVDM